MIRNIVCMLGELMFDWGFQEANKGTYFFPTFSFSLQIDSDPWPKNPWQQLSLMDPFHNYVIS